MKPAIVTYKGKLYLHYNNTETGNAKLLNADGTKFAGKPLQSKLTTIKEFETKPFNGHEYFNTKQGVFSATTGNKIEQQEILDLFKPTVKPKPIQQPVTISAKVVSVRQSIAGPYNRIVVTFTNGILNIVYNECSPSCLLYNLIQLNGKMPKNEFWKEIPKDVKQEPEKWLKQLPEQWQEMLEDLV